MITRKEIEKCADMIDMTSILPADERVAQYQKLLLHALLDIRDLLESKLTPEQRQPSSKV